MSLRAWGRTLYLAFALALLVVVLVIYLADEGPRKAGRMSRRETLGHRSYAPCTEDCAEESFSRFQKRERHYPLWLRVIVVFLALMLAAAFGGTFWPVFTNACEAQQTQVSIVVPDTGALALQVANYTDRPYIIMLGLRGGYWHMGVVGPRQLALFTISGVQLSDADSVFTVVHIPFGNPNPIINPPQRREHGGVYRLQIGTPPKRDQA